MYHAIQDQFVTHHYATYACAHICVCMCVCTLSVCGSYTSNSCTSHAPDYNGTFPLWKINLRIKLCKSK